MSGKIPTQLPAFDLPHSNMFANSHKPVPLSDESMVGSLLSVDTLRDDNQYVGTDHRFIRREPID